MLISGLSVLEIIKKVTNQTLKDKLEYADGVVVHQKYLSVVRVYLAKTLQLSVLQNSLDISNIHVQYYVRTAYIYKIY